MVIMIIASHTIWVINPGESVPDRTKFMLPGPLGKPHRQVPNKLVRGFASRTILRNRQLELFRLPPAIPVGCQPWVAI